MILKMTNRPSLLTVHEFVDIFLPTLLNELKEKVDFSRNDAKNVSENVIGKLKIKFKTNNREPVAVFQDAIVTIVSRETNKYKRLMDKNFGISKDAFDELVKQLKAGNEDLFEKIFLHHFNACVVFVQKKYNTSRQNAYDASMDTLLVFCKKLKGDTIQYGNLQFLFTQMAGQTHLKWLRSQRKKKPFMDLTDTTKTEQFDKESIDLLKKAFSKLGKGCSELLDGFYYNEGTLSDLAVKFKKTPAALRKQKQRCIEKLRNFYKALN